MYEGDHIIITTRSCYAKDTITQSFSSNLLIFQHLMYWTIKLNTLKFSCYFYLYYKLYILLTYKK